MSFSTILHDLRLEKGFSQLDLAKILNITRGTVSQWEMKRIEPNMDTLKKLADIFDVSLDFLCGRVEEEQTINYYEPAPIGKEERELLNYYKQLSKNNKLTLIGFIRGLLEGQSDVEDIFKKGG